MNLRDAQNFETPYFEQFGRPNPLLETSKRAEKIKGQ
jgi:hypothetical protein